jgi:hypothetical protein
LGSRDNAAQANWDSRKIKIRTKGVKKPTTPAKVYSEEAANRYGLKKKPRRWDAGANTRVTRDNLPGGREADDSPVMQSRLRR